MALLFNNLKIQTYAFRYIVVALKELKQYHHQSDRAAEYRNSKLLELYFGSWQIFRLSETKKRLNENLAVHFYSQKIMRRMFLHLKLSNQLFRKVFDLDKIDMIYD